jgi:hypothetical protein
MKAIEVIFSILRIKQQAVVYPVSTEGEFSADGQFAGSGGCISDDMSFIGKDAAIG